MSNNNNEKIKQDAQAASETSIVNGVASEIITNTTKSITGYVNKLAGTEFLTVHDLTIKDLILNALYEFNIELKKEQS